MSDPDLAAGLATAGRERATRYDWRGVADRIEEVYGRVLR
jgi:glycosyltransferase involved in cell wall biosynthesis